MSKMTHAAPPSVPVLRAETVRLHAALLTQLARKYIWWLTPVEALDFPERVVAQVMNIGEFEDARRMIEALGEDSLLSVIRHAEAGQFNERSWHYWHYRLGLAEYGEVPALPIRWIE